MKPIQGYILYRNCGRGGGGMVAGVMEKRKKGRKSLRNTSFWSHLDSENPKKLQKTKNNFKGINP